MFSNPNAENHTVLIFLSCQFIRLCSNSHPPKLDSRTDSMTYFIRIHVFWQTWSFLKSTSVVQTKTVTLV